DTITFSFLITTQLVVPTRIISTRSYALRHSASPLSLFFSLPIRHFRPPIHHIKMLFTLKIIQDSYCSYLASRY
ncbi:MAG: hypothetical protein P8104_13295, partial [Gammaproteobacteria bacterium]